jgi:hypothetical protein
VAVLGASNYTYACAAARQTMEDWLGAIADAFEFFGYQEARAGASSRPPVRKLHVSPLKGDSSFLKLISACVRWRTDALR